MDPVVHFEMPFEDRKRMATFYRSAFGWQTQMLGEDMGNYVLATTVETGEKGPKRPGAINGGFYPKRLDWPVQHPSVVIAVDDIRKAIAKVAKAGGSVLGEPMEIPGVGSYVSFMDSEGNRVSMLQPIPRNWHGPKKKAKKKVAKKKMAKKKAAKTKAGRKKKTGRRTAGKRT
jgi:predicted enzyme related to lactoylglutathione lyase